MARAAEERERDADSNASTLSRALSVADRTMSSVREHPVPAAMIGAGLAWLLLESKPLRPAEERLMERGRELLDDMSETFTGAAANTRKALNNAAGVAGEYLGSAAESVREYTQRGASRVGSAVRESAGAVGEAAQNAVRHGSPRGNHDCFHVLCACRSGKFIIEITDHGIGFSPSSVPPPVAEDLKISGYGLCLMVGLVDEVEFHHPPQGGTTVKLVKRYAEID